MKLHKILTVTKVRTCCSSDARFDGPKLAVLAIASRENSFCWATARTWGLAPRTEISLILVVWYWFYTILKHSSSMKFKPQATIILAVGWSNASLVQVAWYVLLSQSMGWRQTCNRPNHDETMRLTDCSHLNHSAKNHTFYCLNCYSRHPIIHQSKINY